MMRSLFVQRQIDVMVRLGDRPDSFDNRLPVLSLVIAVKDISIGGPGEDSVAAVPSIHRHAFDVGPDMIGQTAGQHVPSLTAVAAAGDARVRRVQVPPGAGSGLGSGDK